MMSSAPKSDTGAGSNIEDIQMKDKNKTRRQDEDVGSASPVEKSGCSSGNSFVIELLLVLILVIWIVLKITIRLSILALLREIRDEIVRM